MCSMILRANNKKAKKITWWSSICNRTPKGDIDPSPFDDLQWISTIIEFDQASNVNLPPSNIHKYQSFKVNAT